MLNVNGSKIHTLSSLSSHPMMSPISRYSRLTWRRSELSPGLSHLSRLRIIERGGRQPTHTAMYLTDLFNSSLHCSNIEAKSGGDRMTDGEQRKLSQTTCYKTPWKSPCLNPIKPENDVKTLFCWPLWWFLHPEWVMPSEIILHEQGTSETRPMRIFQYLLDYSGRLCWF